MMWAVASSVAAIAARATAAPSPSPRLDPDAVCARWAADRSDLSPPAWSGSFNCARGRVNASDAGTVTETDKIRMIAQLNLYRWLVGYDNVISHGGSFPDDMRNPGYPQYKSSWAGKSRDEAAQACSYMLGHNSDIHFGHDDYCYLMGHIGTFQPQCGNVDPSSPAYRCYCYTISSDEATFLGGIAAFHGAVAIDAYIVDYGSISTTPLGHRRLMFAEHLGPVGVGSVNGAPRTNKSYSCLGMVSPTAPVEQRDWVAFPGPGYIPFEAMYPYGTADSCTRADGSCSMRNNDFMGWHFQSLHADLSSASVSIEMKAEAEPDGRWASPGPQRKPIFAPAVAVSGVSAGNTLVFGPAMAAGGTSTLWSVQPGARYRVTVTVPTGGLARRSCHKELESTCASARHASAGDCFVCVGTHQRAMHESNCSVADLNSFCDLQPDNATLHYEFGVLGC